MRVLILSITAGEGHNSTAKAISNYFTGMGIESTVLDTFEYISPLLCHTISKGYLITSKYTKGAYRKVYRIAENKQQNTSRYSVSNLANSVLSSKLRHFIDAYKPDAVVCTHVFAAQILNALKLKGVYRELPTIGIVTDFNIHPFWPDVEQIEYIVVASDLMEAEMRRKGMDVKKMLPFGIPINPKFSVHHERGEARAHFGFDADKFTVLIMSGSMGYGHMEQMIEQLDDVPLDFQIVSVCGNNKAAKEKIDGLKLKKKLFNFGFTTEVNILMDAADCIITKPGGLTTSEALAKGLPMIAMTPIPGQEDRNLEFLLNNGVAMYASKTTPIGDVIFQFFRHPEHRAGMVENMKLIGRPESTRTLCEFVRDLGELAPGYYDL